MDLSVDCRACGGCNRSSVLHEYAEGTLGRRIFNPERKRGLCGFVELLTDGAYYMPDIQLLVGRSSTEAERKRRERLRLQAQKLLSNSKADICPPENRDKEIREQKCARTNIRTYEVTEEDVV